MTKTNSKAPAFKHDTRCARCDGWAWVVLSGRAWYETGGDPSKWCACSEPLAPASSEAAKMSSIAHLERALAEAQRKSHAAMDRRRALPAGSSRARVTTANANWARAAEHRDRCAARLDAALAAQGRAI